MRLLAISTCAALALAVCAYADEEKVPLDKLPKPVLEAVKKRFPKAEMVEASKEVEDGKTSYEVTIKDGTTKYDVTTTPEGTITGLEKEIPIRDLPEVVAKAIAKKHPKGMPKLAEEVYTVKDGKEAMAYYEVVVIVGETTHEVQILADGTIKDDKVEEKSEEKKKK